MKNGYKKVVSCENGIVTIHYTSGNIPFKAVALLKDGRRQIVKNELELPRELLHDVIAFAGGCECTREFGLPY